VYPNGKSRKDTTHLKTPKRLKHHRLKAESDEAQYLRKRWQKFKIKIIRTFLTGFKIRSVDIVHIKTKPALYFFIFFFFSIYYIYISKHPLSTYNLIFVAVVVFCVAT